MGRSLKKGPYVDAKLLKKKIVWQEGNVIPSKDPGLGVGLDEAVCEAHPWEGGPLHLEMAQDPLFP